MVPRQHVFSKEWVETMLATENQAVPEMVESSTRLMDKLDHPHHEHHRVKMMACILRHRGWELHVVGGIKRTSMITCIRSNGRDLSR
ncbi:hypothetical protein GF325_08450 [Candidatus Bathyarchaeota archaeon]|nr:hypothetical protein [Candidatus Bathyarchaeota archaeon]